MNCDAADILAGALGVSRAYAYEVMRDAVAALDKEREPPAGKYDIVLRPFVALMERELHANCHKGDRPSWLNLTRDGSMFEVYDHAAKLAAALRVNDHERIREHGADVANAAMMVLDAWGILVEPKAEPQ